jgi:hypothetical protein
MTRLRKPGRELAVFLRGWVNYFRLTHVKNTFEELDKWIRRKLRLILGASHMNAAVPAKWLQQQELKSLLTEHQRLTNIA